MARFGLQKEFSSLNRNSQNSPILAETMEIIQKVILEYLKPAKCAVIQYYRLNYLYFILLQLFCLKDVQILASMLHLIEVFLPLQGTLTHPDKSYPHFYCFSFFWD